MPASRDKPAAPEYRVNERIRIPRVLVIDENGVALGEMATFEALALAQERDLDLVEVAPTQRPPVTRIMDYGRWRYEQARKEREARKHAGSSETKEVQLSIRIGPADLETKTRRARQFLGEGHRVKLSLRFRGREVSRPAMGRELLDRVVADLTDVGKAVNDPLLEGKQLNLVLAPIKTNSGSTEVVPANI